MINFGILAHDTELPKRFYDGSVRQSLINAEKKLAELQEEMDAINDDYIQDSDHPQFKRYQDLDSEIFSLENELKVLR